MSDYKVTLTRPNAPGHLREVIIRDAANENDAIDIAENMYGGEARIAVLHCGGGGGSSSSDDDGEVVLGILALILIAGVVYAAIHAWQIILAIGAVGFILWLFV
ncbi:hypothetical protein SSZBM1_35 [Synechococcus phage S-SZBM1]|uniref:Uncharacterized protein n=1 Tax=Synechococcus phage S-SZBM1 TaxID=2926475 RepID=A0AC61TSE3_9CAUD|nr:hypothetical protein PP650_gp035 [Synechococcus phage S-SZBM1]UNH61152.1 hypothetical protein SSZBM1_35 [Synechococcus phage S-SZBM1]